MIPIQGWCWGREAHSTSTPEGADVLGKSLSEGGFIPAQKNRSFAAGVDL